MSLHIVRSQQTAFERFLHSQAKQESNVGRFARLFRWWLSESPLALPIEKRKGSIDVRELQLIERRRALSGDTQTFFWFQDFVKWYAPSQHREQVTGWFRQAWSEWSVPGLKTDAAQGSIFDGVRS